MIVKQKHGGAIFFFFNYGFTKTAAVLAKFNVAGIAEAIVDYVKKIVNHKEAILALQNILDPESTLGKFLLGKTAILKKFSDELKGRLAKVVLVMPTAASSDAKLTPVQRSMTMLGASAAVARTGSLNSAAAGSSEGNKFITDSADDPNFGL